MASAGDPQVKQSGGTAQSGAAQQSSRGNDATHRAQRELATSGLTRTTGRFDSPARMFNPFETMWQLAREFDRLMNSALGGMLPTAFAHDQQRSVQGSWAPQFDVVERQDALLVRADLPGLNKEDIHIEVGDETLIIRGERRHESDTGDQTAGYRIYERNYGTFYRTIPLPQHAKLDQLKASMRDGVLTVTVPLDERSRPRRITIEG